MRHAHAGALLLVALLLVLGGCGSNNSRHASKNSEQSSHQSQRSSNESQQSSTDSQYSTLLKKQGTQLKTTISQLETAAYNGSGVWSAGNHSAGPWGVYQSPATAEAALANDPSAGNLEADREHEARVAEETINAGIASHNASGGFEPSSDTDAVDGAWFAEDLGFVGDVLYKGGWLRGGTLQSWEQRLVSYVRWLQSTGNTSWYTNGNVNLRFALIMLEARNLATDAGDATDAAEMSADLSTEEAFTVNPCAGGTCTPGAGRWGWHQDGNAGYFSETPSGWPNDWSCDNSPCTGFDPEYTALQLQDALTGYVISGYDGWWQNIVVSEYNRLAPLVSSGRLNQANGSRKNDPPFLFFPPVYAVLDEHNLTSDDAGWQAQMNQYQTDANIWVANAGSQGPEEYRALAAPAVAVLDAEQRSSY
jgi:hypothetical protein